uniref:C2H2-type domain-containing protein n=1 Tax=Jaculus jaculus TaxID=51337 RepID=A0A8C5KU59_JACJA
MELAARALKKKEVKNRAPRAFMVSVKPRCPKPQPHLRTHPRPFIPRDITRVNCVGNLLNTQAIWSCINGLIQKPFECNICGKHFSQAGNLQTHLRRHSGEKPYICEICGKRFAASGDVQRHIIIHSGEKPHLCDTCGRVFASGVSTIQPDPVVVCLGFSNFSNLKEHKKTHTADKVFTCDECGKCFGGSGDLRRHVRTHTGEKPYTCEVCGKCFTRSAVLRRHKKMASMRCEVSTALALG